MSEYLQVALPNSAPRHSGRGIRFEIIPPDERDQMLHSVAVLAGSDANKLSILRQREGVKRMLRAVTRDGHLTEEQVFALPESGWMKVDEQVLADDEAYKKLFTTRDDELLCWLYRDYHEISKADVDAIAGKVRTVSVG
jgi:hypothetical protein